MAHEDGTWTTDLFDCPKELDTQDLNAVNLWIIEHVCDLPYMKNVVLFAVYNDCIEMNEDN